MMLTRRSMLTGILGLQAILTTASAKVYAKRVPFQNGPIFDEALTKSMKEGFEAIDVEFPEAYARRMPASARAWLGRIVGTGGEVRFKDVTPKARGVWIVLVEVIAGLIGPFVINKIQEALRDVAADYHAVVVGQGVDAETAEILGIEFYRRGSPSWAEAYDHSQPIKLPA